MWSHAPATHQMCRGVLPQGCFEIKRSEVASGGCWAAKGWKVATISGVPGAYETLICQKNQRKTHTYIRPCIMEVFLFIALPGCQLICDVDLVLSKMGCCTSSLWALFLMCILECLIIEVTKCSRPGNNKSNVFVVAV